MAKSSKGRGKGGGAPDKRSMNLYFKPDRTTGPATAALYILFGLTLLLAAAKFGVYDLVLDLRESRGELARVRAQEQQYADQLADYDEVAQRYRLYAATQEETNTTDRLQILDLLVATVNDNAVVDDVSIAGGSVSVRLSGMTLGQTAEILRTIRRSDLVLSATVNTAATESGDTVDAVDAGDPSLPVIANITIVLAKESEATAS